MRDEWEVGQNDVNEKDEFRGREVTRVWRSETCCTRETDFMKEDDRRVYGEIDDE